MLKDRTDTWGTGYDLSVRGGQESTESGRKTTRNSFSLEGFFNVGRTFVVVLTQYPTMP